MKVLNKMKEIKQDEINIAVIGLGYVGLPLAVEFSKHYPVLGFDLNTNRINELKKGVDRTNEVSKDELFKAENLTLSYTRDDLDNSCIYK